VRSDVSNHSAAFGPPRNTERKRHVVQGGEVDGGSAPRGVDGAVDEDRQPPDVLRADDHVDGIRAPEDAVALLLRHASRHRDDRPRAFLERALADLAEAREELLLGAFADAARIDHDDVRIPIVRGGLVAGLVQQTGHALRVVDVHLAAVRLDEVLPGHVDDGRR